MSDALFDYCHRCKGTGVVVTYDFYGDPTEEDCPDCKGRTLPGTVFAPDTENPWEELRPETPAKFLARTEGPDTSHAAAAAVPVTRLEAEVLAAIRSFGSRGVIADELLEAFPALSYSSVTARPSALKRKDLVVDTGDRRVGRSGRRQAVLVATEFFPDYQAHRRAS